MGETIGLAALIIFPLCMVFATFYDVFTMTIPNRITLALVVTYAVLAPFSGLAFATIAWSIGIAFIVLVMGFALFSAGVMGGGDAKLLSASALWFGSAFTLEYIVIASVLGGLLTLFIIVARSMPVPPRLMNVEWITRLHDKKQGVPYGAALGPAALIVFVDTPWMSLAATGTMLG
ncbi:MAG: prepilin peptidase [Pseudomonadota bacterium]